MSPPYLRLIYNKGKIIEGMIFCGSSCEPYSSHVFDDWKYGVHFMRYWFYKSDCEHSTKNFDELYDDWESLNFGFIGENYDEYVFKGNLNDHNNMSVCVWGLNIENVDLNTFHPRLQLYKNSFQMNKN